MSNIDDSKLEDMDLGWGDDDPVDIEAEEQYDELYGEREKFARTKGFANFEPMSNWLINGYVTSEGITLVKGEPGSFKSFAVLDWACCITTGKPWLDCRVRPGMVVYVSACGAGGLRKRVKGWADTYNDGENIDDLLVVGDPVNFKDARKIDDLIREINSTCGAHGTVKLVIIDSIERCIGGHSDSYVVRACDRIRAMVGSSVLVVKGSNNGDSELNAACDSEVIIKRVGNFEYVLTNTKQRDGDLMPCIEIQMSAITIGVTDENGDKVTTLVRCGSKSASSAEQLSAGDPVYEKIYSYHLSEPLAETKWFSASELCTWHGEKQSMGTRWGKSLTKLHADGKIERRELRQRRNEYRLPVRNASSSNVKEDK